MKSIFKAIVVFVITLEARMVLSKYKPKIVAITGSVGKTSSKDSIAAVLSTMYKVRKSEKSFNSEIGVPLTILGLPNAWGNPFAWLMRIYEGFVLWAFPHHYPEMLVLEVGADRPYDIKKISSWLRPDVVVFTKVGNRPVHVEFFESVEQVVSEKAHLVKSLKPEGLLVYCGDDTRVRELGIGYTGRSVSFGCEGELDFFGGEPIITYNKDGLIEGIEFPVNHNGNSQTVVLGGALGRQHVYASVAAMAVADEMRVTAETAAMLLSNHETPPGRMHVIRGIKDTILIDDTYNSSPVAVEEALKTLKQAKTKGKKIAVLGDMLELGALANEAHKDIGKLVATCADVLVAVGVRAKWYIDGALDAGLSEKKVYHFDDSVVAGKFLEGILDPFDVALIKGSQSIRMEKAVLEVMAEPLRAEELLVRQEEEWGKR